MQSENRFFDDLAKFLNGAAGTFAGIGREAEASTRERVRQWIGGLDFVSRDEFEAVKAMAAAARDEADRLKARLDAMEARAAVDNPPVDEATLARASAPPPSRRGKPKA